jgi:hypothetical protein
MPRQPHRWQPTCPPPAGLVRPVRPRPRDPEGPSRGEARGPDGAGPATGSTSRPRSTDRFPSSGSWSSRCAFPQAGRSPAGPGAACGEPGSSTGSSPMGGRRYLGAPQVDWALQMASEHSRSPNETRMRLIWVLDASLPVPLVNRPVFDRADACWGVADLLDVRAGVVGEFDGADHRQARQHSADLAREDRFRRQGLEFFRISDPDLADVDRVVGRMLTTRRRARGSPRRLGVDDGPPTVVGGSPLTRRDPRPQRPHARDPSHRATGAERALTPLRAIRTP